MVVSLATYVYSSTKHDTELDTNLMFGLAIADIFIAGALFEAPVMI